jgi:hypothetical protein
VLTRYLGAGTAHLAPPCRLHRLLLPTSFWAVIYDNDNDGSFQAVGSKRACRSQPQRYPRPARLHVLDQRGEGVAVEVLQDEGVERFAPLLVGLHGV